jgi:preprotein translocase subunit SecG
MAEEKPVQTEAPTQAPAALAQQPQKPTSSNGLAIASLIVGVVAFVSGWIPFWGLLTGVAAVILGVLALKQPNGKGLSITGISTGGIAALTSIFATLFFIIAIAANNAYTPYTDDTQGWSDEDTQSSIDVKKDFAKGETATFDTLEVKVNSVERNYTSQTDLSQPDEGMEYVAVNLTAKSIEDIETSIGRYTFTLTNGDTKEGYRSVDIDPSFKSSAPSNDSSVSGYIVFQVPKNISDLKLQYKTRMYNSDDRWKELVYTLAI